MSREVINASGAPSSPLYSQAIKVGDLVYLSGFTGTDAATRLLAGETIGEQTRQAILNCHKVLKAAGSSLEQVIQVTILLSDPDDFEGMNQEYVKSFPKNPPARMVTKLGVSLPKVRISVAMIATTV
jgi:2-iminobutanoate/2-iminopropanoate deaminase